MSSAQSLMTGVVSVVIQFGLALAGRMAQTEPSIDPSPDSGNP